MIDALYVAPEAGYASAEDYYAGASVLPILGKVAVPSLIVTSRDDPFIPLEMFEGLADRAEPAAGKIDLLVTRSGGHCGYLSGSLLTGLSFWAGEAILEWLEERSGNG
jgi:hypothetical protein